MPLVVDVHCKAAVVAAPSPVGLTLEQRLLQLEARWTAVDAAVTKPKK
jgi:hypothetical protein